jgi:hypothetical protein
MNSLQADAGSAEPEIHYHSFVLPVHSEPGVSFTYDEWKTGGATKPIIDKFPVKDPDILQYAQRRQYHKYKKRSAKVFGDPVVRLENSFREKGLQVVIQVRTIELSPEGETAYKEPVFSLHGTMSDHIVASAVMCYEQVNMNTPTIELQVEAEIDSVCHHSPDPAHIAEVWGIDQTASWVDPGFNLVAVQKIGEISVTPARLVAIPNTMRTRFGRMSLLDTDSSGHCRFLMMHLVDPNYRIWSSRNIPPQQLGWYKWAVFDVIDWASYRLPPEIVAMIKAYVDEPTSLDQRAHTHATNQREDMLDNTRLAMLHADNGVEMYQLPPKCRCPYCSSVYGDSPYSSDYDPTNPYVAARDTCSRCGSGAESEREMAHNEFADENTSESSDRSEYDEYTGNNPHHAHTSSSYLPNAMDIPGSGDDSLEDSASGFDSNIDESLELENNSDADVESETEDGFYAYGYFHAHSYLHSFESESESNSDNDDDEDQESLDRSESDSEGYSRGSEEE